ncbi:ferritin-like domain-containing protein [Streptomyces shenzhenensis]|uniref:ferritin-like domain-containing protein n=1 Tax=Streptomyces shenzhenensis TaxID=943815 RepID=UPI003411AA0E
MSGVFVEEMIHLALAANLLNAVGGSPVLDAPHMLPPHPRALPQRHAAPSGTGEQAFNGSPKLLGAATGTMYALKAQAQSLMEMPDGDGTTAGPTFEYVEPGRRR